MTSNAMVIHNSFYKAANLGNNPLGSLVPEMKCDRVVHDQLKRLISFQLLLFINWCYKVSVTSQYITL